MNRYFFVLFLTLLWANPIWAAVTVVQGLDLRSNQEISIETGKKGAVIVFLSALCPCSNSHIDELKSLANEYPDFSFVAVHSNADETKDISQDYFKKANLSFPVIQDKEFQIADQFKALKTPHAFVLTTTGSVVYKGGVSNSKDARKADRKFLREALSDLSQGKSVQTPEGRALGCAITRGS